MRIVLLAVAVVVLLPLPTLTALGARRRGNGLTAAIVAGLFFHA